MTESYWRNIARPIIAQTIAKVGQSDPQALRKALLEVYPFGERKMHPYKIWRDEIKRQLENRQHRKAPKPHPVSPGQTHLF